MVIKNNKSFDFIVRTSGTPKYVDGTVGKKGGICIFSQSSIDLKYIRAEAKEGRMGQRLMAVVCNSKNGRVYLSPSSTIEKQLNVVNNNVWKPNTKLIGKSAEGISLYGFSTYGDLFSTRQLIAISTFSELLSEISNKIDNDSKDCNQDYKLAILTYLSFVLDKCTDYWSTTCSWHSSGEEMRNTFARQAIALAWDNAEANPFSTSTGNWMSMLKWIWEVVEKLPANRLSYAQQVDAQTQTISSGKIISTDPPYYDNIMYADISDFFYVWMRKSLQNYYPELFGTLATPKTEELVASQYRAGSKKAAAEFFLNGMSQAMYNLASRAHPAYPVTIYYAFKQSETNSEGTVSTGWETFIEAVLNSGFSITGTLPMRTEIGSRMVGMDTNALASSIVLVCRKRFTDAPQVSRREFIRELNRELPIALNKMTGETEEERADHKVSAVDLAQAAIGPDMEIFSKYSAVIEANGSKMTVHDALIQINKVLSAYLDKDDDDYDADTRFCKAWFEQNGWKEGEFGKAELLAKAKGTAVNGVVEAGVLTAKSGKVRLIHFKDYPADWDPEKDNRLPVWEGLHHLIKAHQEGGDVKAGNLAAKLKTMTSSINLLATRLYQICEQNGWAEDARPYNELTAS